MDVMSVIESAARIGFVLTALSTLWAIVTLYRWSERRQVAVAYLLFSVGAMLQMWGFAHITTNGLIFALVGPLGYIVGYAMIRIGNHDTSARRPNVNHNAER